MNKNRMKFMMICADKDKRRANTFDFVRASWATGTGQRTFISVRVVMKFIPILERYRFVRNASDSSEFNVHEANCDYLNFHRAFS